MVSRDNIPPSGTHLSDNQIGGVVAMWKGGGITREGIV